MRIYITGQILGLPISHAAAIFEAAASVIRCAGHQAINPLDFINEDSDEELLNSDALFCLHNYAKSRHSLTEQANAIVQGKKVFYEQNPAEFWQFIAEYDERGREALIDELELEGL